MTESAVPRLFRTPIVVLAVQDAEPPFRLVEIGGELVGKAYSVVDVLEFAWEVGMEDVDLGDPAKVRWVGGDQYTWHVTHWRRSP